MRILHTEWSKGWGGQEIRILGECLALIEMGHKVQVAAQPDSQLLENAKRAGVRTHQIRMHKGLAFNALWRLVQIIRDEQIDIIHTHSSIDARLGGLAGRMMGKPIVRSRHLSTPIKTNWLSWFLYMRLSDHVITSGESIRQAMIHNNKMLAKKITSIPAGIDTKYFHPIHPDLSLKQELGLTEEDFVVGTVAVLRSWKGHRTLFEGISLYKEINSNVRLLVLGEGPMRKSLAKLTEELGLQRHIRMLGHITETPPYYSIMDIVILNSYSNEATSQTLPQAMLMEKPVIGTNIGSIPEVIINGETGILINPESPREICNSLNLLYKNPKLRNRLAHNGKNHAKMFFTKTKMLTSTISIYQHLLKKKRSANSR